MNALTPVISKEQAKQITGGRTPLMPVEYETAVNALAACLTIDDTKIWADKADALAAWAKIYHSEDAERKARMLKLHAYRRMAELAAELRPTGKRDSKGYALPGQRSLLRDHGLNEYQAHAAVKLSKLPSQEFEEIVSRPQVPTPGHWYTAENRGTASQISMYLAVVARLVRQLPPRDFSKEPPHQRSAWREHAEEIYDWLAVLLQKRNS